MSSYGHGRLPKWKHQWRCLKLCQAAGLRLIRYSMAERCGSFLIYLAHPAAWYTAEGGINALDVMLKDLESVLLSK